MSATLATKFPIYARLPHQGNVRPVPPSQARRRSSDLPPPNKARSSLRCPGASAVSLSFRRLPHWSDAVLACWAGGGQQNPHGRYYYSICMGSEEPLSLDQTRGTKGGKGGTLSRFLVSSPLPRPLYPGIRSFFSRHAANMGSVYPLGRPDMQASIRPTTARYQPLPFQATYSSRQACSGDHWNGSPCSDPCRKRPPLFAQARAGPENLPGWTDGLANGTWYGYFYGCLPDERPLIGIYVVPYPHDIWPSILSRSRARGPIGCQSRLSVPLFDAEVRKGSSAYVSLCSTP